MKQTLPKDFWTNKDHQVALICGDAELVLNPFPAGALDCCITSPPYWSKRAYDGSTGLGSEPDHHDYSARLVRIFREVRRVLRPKGSLWLNLGDTIVNKGWC